MYVNSVIKVNETREKAATDTEKQACYNPHGSNNSRLILLIINNRYYELRRVLTSIMIHKQQAMFTGFRGVVSYL